MTITSIASRGCASQDINGLPATSGSARRSCTLTVVDPGGQHPPLLQLATRREAMCFIEYPVAQILMIYQHRYHRDEVLVWQVARPLGE